MEKLKDKPWHKLPAAEVVGFLGVNLATGLSSEEVRRRQKEFGPNRVTARRGTPAWKKFLQQFNQPLVYILVAASVVTALLGEWVDSSVSFGVVLINAIVGFLQEAKAETAIEALARMVVTEATVRRDGHKQRVPSEELVPGDVVLLQAGDRVPADAFGLFYWEHGAESRNLGEARTAVVNVIVMVQALYLLNSRSLSRSMFSIGVFSNRWVWLGLAGMTVAQLLFTYAPFMNRLFHTTPVRGEAWLYIVATGVTAYVVVEFEKWVRFGFRRAKTANQSSESSERYD